MPEELNLKRRKRIFLWVLLLLPFFLNDLAYLFLIKDPVTAVVFDFVLRVFLIAIIYFKYYKFGFSGVDLGLIRLPLKNMIPWTLAFLVAYLFIITPLINSDFLIEFARTLDVLVSAVWKGLFGIFFHPYRYPLIEHPALVFFDLTVSLLLVAFTEEFVARSMAYKVLKDFNLGDKSVIFISAIIFALYHWGLGSLSVMATFCFGILAMWLFIKKRSLMPVVVLHYLTNLYFFGKLYLG
ncbi:MAG: CPBP family intramembrane metalloprotease [Halobacteriovoraceae bacterium]|jgi:membrane protease YdiL (CAAX protease family)|nr:CPBP family intramembrane metalloprotease [Halobacteriovoraceae bacterium]MBT5095310.1 CPBP family intramembrane metalloprotease [Halobacteriovoraceae bacterium]